MGVATRAPRSAPVPTFGAGTGPRIVVEDEDDAGRTRTTWHLRQAGFDVVACGGPSTLARGTCPLEEGSVCPAIRDADVVVTTWRRGVSRQVGVTTRLLEGPADAPVVVRSPPLLAHRQRDALSAAEVVHSFWEADLVAAVQCALDRDA